MKDTHPAWPYVAVICAACALALMAYHWHYCNTQNLNDVVEFYESKMAIEMLTKVAEHRCSEKELIRRCDKYRYFTATVGEDLLHPVHKLTWIGIDRQWDTSDDKVFFVLGEQWKP